MIFSIFIFVVMVVVFIALVGCLYFCCELISRFWKYDN